MNKSTSISEQWKDIEGWEFLYQISSLGRVKSLERFRLGRSGLPVAIPEKILKLSKDKFGYNAIMLHRAKYIKRYFVHRLVASAFIPNPLKKRTVNHIDGVHDNNQVSNLEWATYSENHLHAYKNLGRISPAKGKPAHNAKVVQMLDHTGNILGEFINAREAEKSGYNYKMISQCCLGNNKTHKNLIWKFKTN